MKTILANHRTFIPEIDQLRLLAIFGVVVNHLGMTKILSDLPYLSYTTSPILAIISGFLLFRGLDSYSHLWKKIHQRSTTLLIPYIVWTLLYFIFYQGSKMILIRLGLNYPGLLSDEVYRWSLQAYFINFFLGPVPGAFWYLQNLIVALPLCFGFLPIVRYRYALIPILILIFTLYLMGIPLYFSDRFLPFFIFGLWLGIHFPEGLPLSPYPTRVLLGTALLCLATSRIINLENNALESLIKFPMRIVAFWALFLALRKAQSSNWVAYLKAKTHVSFFLHAAHQMVFMSLGGGILLVARAFKFALPFGQAIELILAILILGSSFSIIEGAKRFIAYYAPWLSTILNGTRHRESPS
ncbi:MAG: acyltransferase family protein [Deltaproteobacteria bacterium]